MPLHSLTSKSSLVLSTLFRDYLVHHHGYAFIGDDELFRKFFPLDSVDLSGFVTIEYRSNFAGHRFAMSHQALK